MSVEVILYAKTATKTGLVRFLKDNSFRKAKHFIEEMNTPEMLGFMWFGVEDYESSTGVEATVYRATIEEKEKYKCADWVLHTRTRSSGSYEDKARQNDIIRKARQQFGGTFYNDWYGTNRYTNLSDYEKFSPLEKGVSIIASNSLEKLSHIKDCLNGYENELSKTLSNVQPDIVRSFLVTKDPSIVLYNALMPFLVSVLEYFYGQCFANFIKYDETAKALLIEEKVKIGVADVVSIFQKENSLEQIITQSYNFQNIDSINKAYKKYISVDVLSILSKKKKVNGKVFRVLTKVQEILDARHRFVHELDINYALTKKMYLGYVLAIENTIKLTVEAFKTKGLTIDMDYHK